MANTLPTTTFQQSDPSKELRNTVIEDAPQVSVRRAAPGKLQPRPRITSSMSDDFPTPKPNPVFARVQAIPESPASSDTQSDRDSLWSKGSSHSDFDEMYDVSDSEADDLPIKLSNSVKKHVNSRPRYPSIAIPSPSEWPTVDKLKSSTALSPPTKVMLSPRVLDQLQQRSLRVPSSSTAPSLDGSLASEELAISSCPSTPDIAQQGEGEHAWEAPAQLDPSAFSILRQIHAEDEHVQSEKVLEVPPEAVSEMRQTVESPPLTGRFLGIDTKNVKPAEDSDADDELSALSVPSPGGFFASLDDSIRKTWSGTDPVPNTGVAAEFYGVPFRPQSDLPTSTATSFYNVPWQTRPERPVEQTVSLASPQSEQGPVTARKVVFSPVDTISEVEEIDETYNDTLQQTAAANLDRTQLWLSAQNDYMKAVCEDDEVVDSFKDIEDAVPKTPEQPSPPVSDSSPSKKSVRFAESTLQPPPEVKAKRISPIHDGTFWEGWRHTKRSQRARDVFQHRQARAEAEHVRRTSCSKQHVEQLQGKYEITTAERPAPARPVSSMLPMAAEDEKKEILARAERERQALEQIQSSAWALAAQKEMNGGQLLTSPIVASFKGRTDVKILDLGGQVHCSWAWSVAAEHPEAEVYTTVSSDAEAHVAESNLEGPNNHFVVAAPKSWELPFEDNEFDVVSARNLYAHLKTIWPKGQAADEWDLTLRECLRVLKRGGYLEFDLLDAELVHPGSMAQALGVEFAFNLKTRGYDPCSGKSFLPRLKRAGFGDIKRAWMVLPVADVVPRWVDIGKSPSSSSTITPGSGREDYFGPEVERSIGPNGEVHVEYYAPPLTGSTKDVRAMTGLIGARMWEQWMLKLNSEMGRSEERCLEGVAKALEEGGKANAGWRCLVGWAKKAC
jgi:SAM-dependent methyltransferase